MHVICGSQSKLFSRRVATLGFIIQVASQTVCIGSQTKGLFGFADPPTTGWCSARSPTQRHTTSTKLSGPWDESFNSKPLNWLVEEEVGEGGGRGELYFYQALKVLKKCQIELNDL